MIQHVYEHCVAAQGIERVIVATEDQRIVKACHEFGGDVELTLSSHVSGTDRVAEVASRHSEYDAVLNVQGDEPAIEPETVSAVAAALADSTVQISSAMTIFLPHEAPENSNAVKVTIAANGDALYFSRSLIPYYRDPDAQDKKFFRHLGIYGFRREALLKVTQLPPSALERAESLEQLRWLEAGYRIRCALVKSHSFGIDTPQDLEILLENQSH